MGYRNIYRICLDTTRGRLTFDVNKSMSKIKMDGLVPADEPIQRGHHARNFVTFGRNGRPRCRLDFILGLEQKLPLEQTGAKFLPEKNISTF